LEHLSHGRQKQTRFSISLRKSTIVKAVAVPVAPPAADSKEHRDQLCESYGFRQIGEPLPDNITVKDIIETLPKKVISESF
jgi:acyl-lipid omega-6 desaturase (Delta-12 desaturase)